MAGAAPVEAAVNAEEQQRGIALSLVIGVGGTGHRILLETRRRLIDGYESLDNIPIVQFLQIDTSNEVPTGYDAEVLLKPAEIVEATVQNTKYYRDNLDQFPHLRSWIPRHSPYERVLDVPIAQGASAIRARGRFAYAVHRDQIAQKIRSAVSHICQANVLQRVQQRYRVDDRFVNVYVVGSLMGGTGSGIALDLAYSLKGVIARMIGARHLSRIGLFVIPPVAGGVSGRVAANGYAALRELSHFSRNGVEYRFSHSPADGRGRAQHREMEEESDPHPPFDYCYLLDTHNEEGSHIKNEELVQMMGHSIFLDLTSDFAERKKNNRDNFAEYLGGDRWGAPTAFLSFGLASLTFPRDQLMRVCAYRMAKEVMQFVIRPRAEKDSQHLEEEINELLHAAAFDSDNLWHALKGSNRTDHYDPTERMRHQWEELMSRVPEQANATVMGTLEDSSKRFEGMIINRNEREANILAVRDEDLGEFVRSIHQRLKNELDRLKRWLDEEVVEAKVNDPEYREVTTRAILNGFQRRIEQWREALEKAHADLNASLPRLTEDQINLHNKLVGLTRQPDPYIVNLPARKEKRETIRAYCQATLNLQSSQVFQFIYRCARHFYKDFGELVRARLDELHRYDDKTQKLLGQFQREQSDWEKRSPTVNGRLIYDERGTDNVYDAAPRYYNAVLEQVGGLGAIWDRVHGNEDLGMARVGLYRSIMLGKDLQLRDVLTEECMRRFRSSLNQVNVLKLFTQRYGDDDLAEQEMRGLLQRSAPFFNAPRAEMPGYAEQHGQRIRLVGYHEATRPQQQNDAEVRFTHLLGRLGIAAGGGNANPLVTMNDQTEALFLTEVGGFPLRVLRERLRSYEAAYRAVIEDPNAPPVHSRGDMELDDWTPLEPPSPAVQQQAWRNYLILIAASGLKVERKERWSSRGTVVYYTYSLEYTDHKGAGQERILSDGVPAVESIVPPASGLPPGEFLDAVLAMCEREALSPFGRQVEDAVERLKNSLGAGETGQGRLNGLLVRYIQELRRNTPWRDHVDRTLSQYMDETGVPPIPPLQEHDAPSPAEPDEKKPMVNPPVTSPPLATAVSARTLQQQLAKLDAILADPAKQYLHAAAAERKAGILGQLVELEIHGEVDPAAEVERLMGE